ncbi:MAG: DUF1800 domain-containing protein [Bacteroidota bacterium]
MRHVLTFICLALTYLPIRAQLYEDYLGNGHIQNIRVSSSDESNLSQEGIQTINGFDAESDLMLSDASRFLAQATLGSDWEEIQRTSQMGFEAWLEEQMKLPITPVLPNAERFYDLFISLEGDEEKEDEEVLIPSIFFRLGWWQSIMTAKDQLRQRMALALSEIFVVSEMPDLLSLSGYGLADYYDMLLKHSFGNYRDLLMDVSLHPCMGHYLSHYNNPKADPLRNIHPDENYAREIMQLFSIGLYELNLDGSRKLDTNGNPIPTYDNKDIKEFAKVFTGLGAANYRPQIFLLEDTDDIPEETFFNLDFFAADPKGHMKMFEEWHERGEKKLLRGETIPGGQGGMEDIEDAIDNLFNHPNVGPFISRLLIQRLVSSNPSPDYIFRVATVFNDNGKGVRGDLGAVLTAILTDDAARACGNRVANLHRAQLREPLLRYTHFCRALNVVPLDELPMFYNPALRFQYVSGQSPLSSPSVFNFFLPDYQPTGVISDLGLYGPEFQIHNSSTAIRFINEVNDWAIYQSIMVEGDPRDAAEFGEEFEREAGSAELDVAYLYDLAEEPSQLLWHLNILIAHGQLSESSQEIILEALTTLEAEEERVAMALYLIFISPDYAILN